VNASYISGNRQGCLRGTRKGVLWEIEHWLASEQEQHIFWLNGLAGTGKSTIAQTFAERMFADGKLGASFFCSRDFADRSNLQAIFPTLAFQLAYQYQPFRGKLLQVLKACPDVAQESLCSQMGKLIVGPLKTTHIQTLIIIDALDECKDEEPASAILSILSRYVNEIPHVKFFITGRPEPRIRSGFRLKALLPITEVLKLHEVKPEAVNNDIKLFFQTQLTKLAKERSDCNITEEWPSSSEVKTLCEKAAGFFIYATTVVKFIMSKSHVPTKRLKQITSLPQGTSHEGRSGINNLYIQVLKQAVDDVEADDEEFYPHFRTVVGTVLLVFNPLSVNALSDLLRVSGISTALRSLHSLLLVPTSEDAPIRVFHKSFPDFLMDKGRCTDHQFFIDPPIHHAELLFSCLNVMEKSLKKNICGLDDHAILSEVEDLADWRRDRIGDALEYACCFWAKHLLRTPSSGPGIEEVQGAIDKFFTTCLLFWIEVLSLMGKLDIGVYALNDIQQWYTLVSCLVYLLRKPTFIPDQAGVSCKWANDSQRLLLEWFDEISHSPSQLYHLALPFSPSSSWLRECYATELSQEVKVVKGLPVKWGVCSRTVTLDHLPHILTSWQNTIAVALDSGAIVALDGITGSWTAILSGHTNTVKALAFSQDGMLLASGSHDETVKLWDVQTGGVIKTFYGHTNYVHSVSISADCTLVASGSGDWTIHLWDIQIEECHCIIEQQGWVYRVHFSPVDPQHLISVSGDTIWQWNTAGNQINPTHDGSNVDFSLDGTKFVLCQGEDIIVQNSHSGEVMTKFHIPDDYMHHCCFSPDGRLIAAAADSTAYVWDITNSDPHPIETLVGHVTSITSLIFSSSSSLISSSKDQSVKFWQIGALSTDTVVADPDSTPVTSALIMSITLQAKDSVVISCDSDGVVRTWDISNGLCTASFQTPAKGANKCNVQLVNSQLILFWHKNYIGWPEDWAEDNYILSAERVHIWDVEKGEPKMADIALKRVWDMKISGDESKIFCLCHGFIQLLSIQTGERVASVALESGVREFLAVDGSRAWIHSPSLGPLGWDFGTPDSYAIQLSGMPPPHLNTNMWDIKQSQIKNKFTGKVVFQFGGKFIKPAHAQWDGQYLAAGYESGEILILDFNHMLC